MFAPGPLLHPNGTKVRSATHPRNCTICLEAALSHRPFPLLEPGTNRYAKLEKVYSDFLNVGHCGMNDEMYTLTFVNAGTRYVWIVNVEVRSRAYEVFRLLLAHAQRQSGEKLKIWQSDGAAEFRSKEMKDYLAKKGIKHHVSLPYTHQQQGIAEHMNRTLMTKVRADQGQHIDPPRVGVHGAVLDDRYLHDPCGCSACGGAWCSTDACGCSPCAAVPDIPTPCSYAEAITGPYSSQWQAAMDAEMASWKSTGTYVDEVPPPGANIVDGMWIFRVKPPPGSPLAFKARYVA
ncbi:unnamed protein product [Closterium sp. NIES-54]